MPKQVPAKSAFTIESPPQAGSSAASSGILLRGRPASDKAANERNVEAMFKFKIVQDWRGEYRWQLMSRAGRVLAVSGDSYSSADAVKRDVRGMRPELATAPIEVARRVAA